MLSAVEPAGNTLQPMDIFELELADDPQISPDGRQVVYVRQFMDIMTDRQRSSLWTIARPSGEHRPLVTGPQDASQPRFSPDGGRLAYVSREPGEEGPAQLFCRWLDTGQSTRLSHLPAPPANIAWSPDGKWLALTMLVKSSPEPFVKMPTAPEGAKWADPPRVVRDVLYRHDGAGYRKPGFRHVMLISAEGGTPRQLTSGDYHHDGPLAWSPDGQQIYCSAIRRDDWELHPRRSDLYRITVADGKLIRITDRNGPDQHPVVSPDGKQLAWLGFDDRLLSSQRNQIYTLDLTKPNARPTPVDLKLDRSIDAIAWNGAGAGLFIQYDDTGDTKLALTTLAGKLTPLASNIGGVTLGRPYASGSFSVNRQGEFAFTLTSPDHPADVAVGRQGTTEITRLTRLNDDLFTGKQLGMTEEFWFRSKRDKQQIQAWIVTPPNFDPARKYPLILEIHGGPFANYGGRFAAEMQLYAAAGYVVLYVNPSGSTGYGDDFANRIHHDYPGADYDDLMSAVDETLQRGYIDKDRLFVTGGSGGGIMTAWIVGNTHRFRAAVAAKPVINWYSFALTTDVYPYFNGYWFPGMPWDHPEHYLRRSPISLVGKVKTPTMLLTGEEDYRTPMSESEQFYQALKLRQVDTMLVRIPGASHNIAARPSRIILKTQYILRWFETH